MFSSPQEAVFPVFADCRPNKSRVVAHHRDRQFRLVVFGFVS
jgi:hypothetical protein